MISNLVSRVHLLIIAALLSSCTATVQRTHSPDPNYYEGCNGSWDEVRMCAEENKKKKPRVDQTKDDIEIAQGEMAVIIDSGYVILSFNRANITSVDGEHGFYFATRVEVPAGKHMLSIHCVHGYGFAAATNPTVWSIDFDAKTGRKYQVKCSKDDAWIEDTDTNVIVGKGYH